MDARLVFGQLVTHALIPICTDSEDPGTRKAIEAIQESSRLRRRPLPRSSADHAEHPLSSRSAVPASAADAACSAARGHVRIAELPLEDCCEEPFALVLSLSVSGTWWRRHNMRTTLAKDMNTRIDALMTEMACKLARRESVMANAEQRGSRGFLPNAKALMRHAILNPLMSEWIVLFCLELTSQTSVESVRNPRNYDNPCPLNGGGKRELLLPEAGLKHHPTIRTCAQNLRIRTHNLNSQAKLLAANETKTTEFAVMTLGALSGLGMFMRSSVTSEAVLDMVSSDTAMAIPGAIGTAGTASAANEAVRHAAPSPLVLLLLLLLRHHGALQKRDGRSMPSRSCWLHAAFSAAGPRRPRPAAADGADGPPSGAAPGAAAALGAALAAVLLCRWQRNRAQRPPFAWAVLSEDLVSQFIIGGPWKDVVEKSGDYERRDLVIPVNSKVEMRPGGVYRWALVIEHLSREMPEIQFGIQGCGFEKPWRLITTTRCSRACDEETWQRRAEGDRAILEHDVVHLELDLTSRPGVLSMAVNDEPFEVVFADIVTDKPIMPAVMLAGDGGRVRVQATQRRSSPLQRQASMAAAGQPEPEPERKATSSSSSRRR
ncbi:unnamed protein product [Prorocentrum cordatum]|uniref:Uncharacterized protein n=1 Tax=Prorocentrum cordatum TaxID=2364126 RepID=A0ABN9U533_9DINO|nr:unnamed protein product [Polarella glacialis]